MMSFVNVRLAKAALLAGAFAYSSWPLAFLVPTGLSQVASSASEYEAAGHPWAWLFHGADIVSGLLIGGGALAGLVLHSSRHSSWPMRVMLLAIAVRGLATAISGSMPVDCSDSDGQCHALRAAGAPASWHDRAHHLISGYSGSALTIGLVALAVGAIWGGAGPAARRWAVPLIALLLFTELHLPTLLWTHAQRGVPQRISEAGEALFFAVLAFDLGRPPLPGWARRTSKTALEEHGAATRS